LRRVLIFYEWPLEELPPTRKQDLWFVRPTKADSYRRDGARGGKPVYQIHARPDLKVGAVIPV